MDKQDKIELYETEDGQIQIEVRVDEDTVWLTLNQISTLFGRDKSVISRHINNVFKENELDSQLTVAKFATVQQEGIRIIERQIDYFNLDVIISVGYRVKSKRGTQFRIWANKVLKDYILKGFALNENLLKEKEDRFISLKYSVELINSLTSIGNLFEDEVLSLLNVLSRYAKALDILDKYDHQSIPAKKSKTNDIYSLTYEDAVKVIDKLKEKFASSKLFGKEKDKSFLSSISQIYQTFDGKELYPGVELKSVNLLYFLVKNHSFIDGNKRIAAAIFIWFLYKNNILFRSDGRRILDDNALVGLALMIAGSNPKEKDLIIKIVMNLLID